MARRPPSKNLTFRHFLQLIDLYHQLIIIANVYYECRKMLFIFVLSGIITLFTYTYIDLIILIIDLVSMDDGLL